MSYIKLKHPSAASRLADIIELLTERIDNDKSYCDNAIADAKHDLAVLESAGLYQHPPPSFDAALEKALHVALDPINKFGLLEDTKDMYAAGIRYGFRAGWDARGGGK